MKFKKFREKLVFQKTESIKPKNISERIFDFIGGMTTWELAFFSVSFLMIWILIQMWFISQFIEFPWGFFYINIGTSIVFLVVFIFVMILSCFFPFLAIVSFISAFLNYFLGLNVSIAFAWKIILILTIVSTLWFLIKSYRNFILKYYKPLLIFFWILYLIWIYFCSDFIYENYNDVSIKTKTEIISWKLYFSNLEYFFIEDSGSQKIIVPKSAIESIRFGTWSSF